MKKLVLVNLIFCIFTTSALGQPEALVSSPSQLVRGKSIPVLDKAAWVISLPFNLILWNWKFNNHSVSSDTEAKLERYLAARSAPSFEETVFRINQYHPAGDMKALFKNHYVAWPYRILMGLPVTLIYDVLLPGRIFPWGDYFNPYTNVVHIYSDDFAIAMHEAGHAYDQGTFPYKGTYALIRAFYLVTLYQEKWATGDAIKFLEETGAHEDEYHAHRSLWPAYGTYFGGALPIPYVGSAAGALGGHIFAALKVRSRKQYYRRMDEALEAPNKSIESIQAYVHSNDFKQEEIDENKI